MDTIKFEKWVKSNYAGKVMFEPPEDLDPEKNFYLALPDGKHYGPIKFEDTPEEFK